MVKKLPFQRPTFDQALTAWKALLQPRGLPTECLWVFDENLCFEKAPAAPGGFKLGFQTALTPPPPDAERLAYGYFADFAARLVFYRLGACRGKSVCILLCDEWFEGRTESEGYMRRDDWLMSFRPGASEDIEEVTDRQRWQQRLLRDRPRHDLDFCLTLRSLHEILAHGRVLSTYERYALRFLHAWRRLLGREETSP
jgi:hypothetical protein